MGMVHGPPARFDLSGIYDSEARLPYTQQNPTYFYRCLISTCMIAKIVLSETENRSILGQVKAFEAKHQELLF